jgi:ubiquinone/menaquinone biosynthesis C-methylase UbiE
MKRILEPEVMDTWEEAAEYDAMDFVEVNKAFAQKALEIGPEKGLILDAGTGTARIPIFICQERLEWQIIGIDLSQNMLIIGNKNIKEVGLEDRIKLELVDAKNLPYPDHNFDAVISNSIVHHLPDPLPFWQELKRVLKPGGGIFIRDLLRPENEEITEVFVNKYAADCNERQRGLFRDSLKAAFTVDEVTETIENVGLEKVTVYQSSDRHWTAERVANISG